MTVTLDRLRALLDAYGAAPERWPEPERDAARRLCAESTAAAAMLRQAAELDRLLDAASIQPPSPALERLVVSGAPRPRSSVRRRVLVVTLPVAIAASIAIWLTGHDPAHRTDEPISLAVGDYSSPTDVLLGAYGTDVSRTLPSIGCAESTLGCPELEPTTKTQSKRSAFGRFHA